MQRSLGLKLEALTAQKKLQMEMMRLDSTWLLACGMKRYRRQGDALGGVLGEVPGEVPGLVPLKTTTRAAPVDVHVPQSRDNGAGRSCRCCCCCCLCRGRRQASCCRRSCSRSRGSGRWWSCSPRYSSMSGASSSQPSTMAQCVGDPAREPTGNQRHMYSAVIVRKENQLPVLMARNRETWRMVLPVLVLAVWRVLRVRLGPGVPCRNRDPCICRPWLK